MALAKVPNIKTCRVIDRMVGDERPVSDPFDWALANLGATMRGGSGGVEVSPGQMDSCSRENNELAGTSGL